VGEQEHDLEEEQEHGRLEEEVRDLEEAGESNPLVAGVFCPWEGEGHDLREEEELFPLEGQERTTGWMRVSDGDALETQHAVVIQGGAWRVWRTEFAYAEAPHEGESREYMDVRTVMEDSRVGEREREEVELKQERGQVEMRKRTKVLMG
jgi:hypothetical protein